MLSLEDCYLTDFSLEVRNMLTAQYFSCVSIKLKALLLILLIVKRKSSYQHKFFSIETSKNHSIQDLQTQSKSNFCSYFLLLLFPVFSYDQKKIMKVGFLKQLIPVQLDVRLQNQSSKYFKEDWWKKDIQMF